MDPETKTRPKYSNIMHAVHPFPGKKWGDATPISTPLCPRRQYWCRALTTNSHEGPYYDIWAN